MAIRSGRLSCYHPDPAVPIGTAGSRFVVTTPELAPPPLATGPARSSLPGCLEPAPPAAVALRPLRSLRNIAHRKLPLAVRSAPDMRYKLSRNSSPSVGATACLTSTRGAFVGCSDCHFYSCRGAGAATVTIKHFRSLPTQSIRSPSACSTVGDEHCQRHSSEQVCDRKDRSTGHGFLIDLSFRMISLLENVRPEYRKSVFRYGGSELQFRCGCS
jgi:hypothetical protein